MMPILLRYLAAATAAAPAVAKLHKDDVPLIPHPTAVDVLNGALNVVYFTSAIVAVIVIILAGYKFVTAVYEPAKIAQAKNQILYAVIGLIVVMFAFAATQFILGRF